MTGPPNPTRPATRRSTGSHWKSLPARWWVDRIGPSGAGKSSLIRCVNRLIEPTSGKIFLGERDVTALSRSDLRVARRRIGMIFQEYALVER
ncbi:ATP-binding cassette domain-containing protein [Brucella rhizosphaerae]|uniref:ATP-binding cassette domain-containing protein n=1 Tax=Brucella rhizosphaerae TaxID=571254 RepID=UPI00362A3EC1